LLNLVKSVCFQNVVMKYCRQYLVTPRILSAMCLYMFIYHVTPRLLSAMFLYMCFCIQYILA